MMKLRKLRLVTVLTIGLFLPGCSRPVIAPGHRLSLRLADVKSNDGMVLTKMMSTGERVFLHAEDIIDENDFVRIWTTLDAQGRRSMMFKVTESAGKKIHQITAENPGKLIAIVVNGFPETTVPIVAPFSDSFQVTGAFDDSDIDVFMESVTGYKQK